VLDADGRLALVAVLAAGTGGLEGVHLALFHELLVRQFQVFFPLPILNNLATSCCICVSLAPPQGSSSGYS
jgi:hypothetical protein